MGMNWSSSNYIYCAILAIEKFTKNYTVNIIFTQSRQNIIPNIMNLNLERLTF